MRRRVFCLIICFVFLTTSLSPKIQAASNMNPQAADLQGLASFYTANEPAAVELHRADDAENSFYGDITEEGIYNIKISYIPQQTANSEIEINIKIDNTKTLDLPLITLEKPLLYGEITKDEDGGDVRAKTTLKETEVSTYIRLKTGLNNEYAAVRLDKGETCITVTDLRNDCTITGVTLTKQRAYPSYRKLKDFYSAGGWQNAAQTVKIQAENIYSSSASFLNAQFDRSGAGVEPADPYHMLLNIAGGTSWRQDGTWLEWETQIDQGGLYALRIKARQNAKSGFVSYRRLYVDGEAVCSEAEILSFPYSEGWKMVTLSDGNEEILLPLEKGRHTIRLEVVPGTVAEEISRISLLLNDINELYRKIIMVTGATPDLNRDYYLEREIEGLTGSLKELADKAKTIENNIKALSGKGGAELVSLSVIAEKLTSFGEKPGEIPSRLGSFKSDIDGLAAWLLTASEQPLDIDYLELVPPGSPLGSTKVGFFKNLWYGINSLVASFVSGKQKSTDSVNVWLNAGGSIGRDQLNIIQSLCDDNFTPATGIKVKISLVSQGINDAIIAGVSPDAVLYTPEADVNPIAIRGGLEPLNGYNGFDSLMKELQPQAIVPYEYEGTAYGIPLTQNFPLMFVRDDIFADLGISAPNTWDELKKVIPVIQRHNMQVGIPSGDTTFLTMLFQTGSGLYGSDGLTTLSSDVSVSSFRNYARLFSDYGLPLAYDFFNRFRTGELPLALADYTEYGRITAAAPEIAGLWSVYQVPGTLEGGEINRSVMGGGLGAYILSAGNKKQDAWEFLKWFAGGEAQAQFGIQNEAILGITGRYAPANVIAFERLPWREAEKSVIRLQREEVKAVPQPPGAYYVSRNITNAFRSVVIDKQNPREALYKYANEIDRELARKTVEIKSRE